MADDIRRLVCGKALCIRREDDQETAEAAADELGSWVARKVAQRDARIVELEAQVAAFRAPAEAAGYTVSADGKCWTGNGGGREFFQGPPINVTHREEPETVDHLAEAQEHLAEIGTQSLAGDNEIGAAMQSIAHAAIAQAELRGGGSGRVTDTCDGCKHLRVDHRRSVLWCFYLQRDLPTTEYGTQVRDDECPLREDGEPE